ncbi:MAG: hypothetical protein JO270_00170 [Acidobacteriaceae bacterium]|nr:hypothetical protein [Acidobacteriaceae bacterium]
MNPKAKGRQEAQGISLADQYFRSIENTNRLEEMLSERVVELVGAIDTHNVDFEPFDDAVLIQYAPNSLAVTETGQDGIYALGFKRIFVHHQNGLETIYYQGGPTKGKTQPREK